MATGSSMSNDDDDDIYSGFTVLEEEDRSNFLADSSVFDAVQSLNKSRRPVTAAPLGGGGGGANFGRGAEYLAAGCESSGAGQRRHLGTARVGSTAARTGRTGNNNSNVGGEDPSQPGKVTISRISTTRGAGFRPGTGGVRVTLSRGATSGGTVTRQGTGRPTANNAPSERPMTAITGAGFRSRLPPTEEQPTTQHYDVPDFEPKGKEEKEKKQMEKNIRKMCQDCAILSSRGKHKEALSLAKEAGKLERTLSNLPNAPDNQADYTWMVLNNLSLMYAGSGAISEAINANRVIIKTKNFDPLWRIKTKLNTGVLYYRQGKYERAIKLFRMALDNITDDESYKMGNLRRKTRRNIAICLIRMKNFKETIRDLEVNMKESEDFENGFNLVVCSWLVGNYKESMRAFSLMLKTKLGVELGDDKYQERPNDKTWNKLLEVIRVDELRNFEKEKINDAHRLICLATKIIAKDIQKTHAAGFDWCIEQVKSSESYREFAADIEIGKAIHFLKEKDTEAAIRTLKAFERQDHKIKNCSAAINLSFLYFHERDYRQAAKFVDVAIEADRYNPAALVNKGVIYFREGKYDKSREFFREAIGTESTSVEAHFNLGLANRALASSTKDSKYYEEALECFLKLHNIIMGYPPVIYQIADLYEKLNRFRQSAEWFLQLQGLLPTDPGCLKRIGEIYDHDFQDKAQAFQYHMDSYRYFPSELETIEWLGAYYIESAYWEKAIEYFERAAVVQPDNSRWSLVIASCYRRAGNYSKALETYKNVHKKFPDNEECLKFIVKLASDLRLPEADTFAAKLKDLQKKQTNKNKNRQSSVNTSKCITEVLSPRLASSRNDRWQEADRAAAHNRQKEIERELDLQRSEQGGRPSAIEALLSAIPSNVDFDDEDDDESMVEDTEMSNVGAAYNSSSPNSRYTSGQVMKSVDLFFDEDDECADLPDALLPL